MDELAHSSMSAAEQDRRWIDAVVKISGAILGGQFGG